MEPFELAPRIPGVLQTKEQRLAANLCAFQHFLIKRTHVAFEDIRNPEFLWETGVASNVTRQDISRRNSLCFSD
jgi:hypothetical protein